MGKAIASEQLIRQRLPSQVEYGCERPENMLHLQDLAWFSSRTPRCESTDAIERMKETRIVRLTCLGIQATANNVDNTYSANITVVAANKSAMGWVGRCCSS